MTNFMQSCIIISSGRIYAGSSKIRCSGNISISYFKPHISRGHTTVWTISKCCSPILNTSCSVCNSHFSNGGSSLFNFLEIKFNNFIP